MLGAIIGDIIGSPYEFSSGKSKSFPLFVGGCRPTDDSVMTAAVALACLDGALEDREAFQENLVAHMKELGQTYPDAGYGAKFYWFLREKDPKPYGSFGNGSAMRVSPVAYATKTLERVEELAQWSAEVSHDHPEGIKGAQAVAAAVFMARTGKSKEEIKAYIEAHYYKLDFTLDEIRPTYRFDVTCQGSVPQAIVCFLEAESYEDAVRNAVSLGGDSDTIAAMAGSIAEPFFGIPEEIEEEAFEYIDEELAGYITEFSSAFDL